MHPILDIRRLRTDRYTYSLGAAPQHPRPCEDLFDSVDRCLHDAGEALANYFERVDISYAGIPLGTHPVATLQHDPPALVNELLRRLAATHQRHRSGAPATH